jgi:uncharacterized circularly permuted ATP-grasp superfamily protein
MRRMAVPGLFGDYAVAPGTTPRAWRRRCAPSPPESPERSPLVVLTPGPYNSTYFEHTFLARTTGASTTPSWTPRCSARTACWACAG